jgi:hypothetical protein
MWTLLLVVWYLLGPLPDRGAGMLDQAVPAD